MSDTPRTDQETFWANADGGERFEATDADFARELERENATRGQPTDEPDPNGTTFARLNWWKDRCVALAKKNTRLQESMQEAWKIVNAMAGQEYWQRAEDWLAENHEHAPREIISANRRR